MRSAVESLPQSDRGGYYPGKFTEKMERRGLAVASRGVGRGGVGPGGGGRGGIVGGGAGGVGVGGQSYLQIPVQRQEGSRGKALRSWTPWPSWTIR